MPEKDDKGCVSLLMGLDWYFYAFLLHEISLMMSDMSVSICSWRSSDV
jgi:hypothetical protein